MESKEDSKLDEFHSAIAINIFDYARKQWYADPKNKGATMKNVDMDAMIAKIVKENEANLQVVKEDEEEDEVEDTTEKVSPNYSQLYKQDEEQQEEEEEDEPAGMTLRIPLNRGKKAQDEEEDEVIPEAKEEEDEEDEENQVTQKPKPNRQQQEEEEEDEDNGVTTKVPVNKKQKQDDDEDEPEQPKQPEAPKAAPKLVIKESLLENTKNKKEDHKIELKIREAQDLRDITNNDPLALKEHELFLYKEGRIVHAQAYLDYKDEAEYKDNRSLLVKRACQKQTIIKTDLENFEAQDTEEKVENFLRKNSRYFKDVVKITQLAKGGEAIVYTLEHSLPDELVIKCPILTDKQKNLELPIAFNGIIYESQTINLNPHQGHVVNNVEEIILYNEKLKIITNYCVIVEKAKYTLETVIKKWSGTNYNKDRKAKERDWDHESQDFFTPEKLTFYFFQTLMATAYFHNRNIYYGDMKGANLLIFRNQEVKIGDLGISVKLTPVPEGQTDEKLYFVKGLTDGFVLPDIVKSAKNGKGVTRDLLLRNDKFAIQKTFEAAISGVDLIYKEKKAEIPKRKPAYLDMLEDVKNAELTLPQIVDKWAVRLDSDTQFKNKLCNQLKLEYKFLGLPKVHLMLDQQIMQNFYMKKQIVYKKEVPEDDIVDPGSDFFKVHDSKRDKVNFPFKKEGADEKQSTKEKIDFYWSLKAAKSTRDDIKKEQEKILEEELGLERKRINEKMHDFKDFEIKKALAQQEKSLIQIQLLDAISGPNNEGLQIELQHKLCFEIAKGLRDAKAASIGKKDSSVALYFLRRVEQIFILEFNEKDKESNFKEQHVKRLKDQIIDNYHLYKKDITLKHTIQFAFYSYFMYKDLSSTNTRVREDLKQQISYLRDAMEIFKNLMGENIELQNKIIHRKAIAHMQLEDEENYLAANEDFKRLYLTKKSLESFHDYVYSYEKLLSVSQKFKKVSKDKKEEKVYEGPYTPEEIRTQIRFKYDLQSGFLLFKEFFNKYYGFVPSFGIENKKVISRLGFLGEMLFDQNGKLEKDPAQFFELFKNFLKQINDNSFENISQNRPHLYSYDTHLPKNSFLNLEFKKCDMEQIEINRSILSDDIEFLLNQQQDKVTLKKLIFHFDINKFIIAIDSEFRNSRTQKTYKTDHYKELKQYEQSVVIPDFVYVISVSITDDEPIQEQAQRLMANTENKDAERQQEEKRRKEEEEKVQQRATLSYIVVQLSNFQVIKVQYDKIEHLNVLEGDDGQPELPELKYPEATVKDEKEKDKDGKEKKEEVQVVNPKEKEGTFRMRLEVRKTYILFNRLTKPFNDYVMGTFQFYNPLTTSLQIQNYYFKMSKRQYIISLMRHCFSKLQIVHHPSQLQNFNQKDTLVVYRNKYLFSNELLQNPRIKKDLAEGKKSFNWLFGQEKLLNQRKTDFKQYCKDVRNHLIYHMRQYFTDAEDHPVVQFKKKREQVIELQKQMGKTINVLECFDQAITKMFDGIKQRYQFTVQEDNKSDESNEITGTATLGYKLIDKKQELKDSSQLSELEQQIYFYEIAVLLKYVQYKGYNVTELTSVQYGQDYFLISLKFKYPIQKDEHGRIKRDPIDLKASEAGELLSKYLAGKESEFKKETIDIFNDAKYNLTQDVLKDLQAQFSQNLRANLNEFIKKDKLFPHLMRVLPVPFHQLFQSELYSYQTEFDEDQVYPFSEKDLILLQLMLLKSQYKTKTPSSTIRSLKYSTQKQFNVEILNALFEELKANAEGDSQQKQLLQFYKEQIFRYHLYDTNPYLLAQWKSDIAQHFESAEIAEFANLFFYSSYDYYSINVNILIQQMRDFFSVLDEEVIRTCVQKIFLIVLARIQGSLSENRDAYVNFFKQYFPDGSDQYKSIVEKIDSYIEQENKDNDYMAYEAEFKEYNDCGLTISSIKEKMPVTRKSPERLDQPQELVQEYESELGKLLDKTIDLLYNTTLVSNLSSTRNIILQALSFSVYKQTINDVNESLLGNILLKKLILKSSNTKHRIFNQYRVIKKYLTTLEESFALRAQRDQAQLEEIFSQDGQLRSILTDRKEIRTVLEEVRIERSKTEEQRIADQAQNEQRIKQFEQIKKLDLSKDLLKRLYNLMNKNYVVTLQEQYDHNYLPKGKEVFNRLDEWHRLTNFDDFERIVRVLAENESQSGQVEVQNSKFLLNKFIDIQRYPTLKSVKFYVNENGEIFDVAALYNLNGQEIIGGSFNGQGLEQYQSVQIDLQDGEVIDDITSHGNKIDGLVIRLGRDGLNTTEEITIDSGLKQVRNAVTSPQSSRRVISFSGLRTSKGLLNFNLYFYHCLESPEEKHVFIEEDSDADDYFNDEN